MLLFSCWADFLQWVLFPHTVCWWQQRTLHDSLLLSASSSSGRIRFTETGTHLMACTESTGWSHTGLRFLESYTWFFTKIRRMEKSYKDYVIYNKSSPTEDNLKNRSCSCFLLHLTVQAPIWHSNICLVEMAADVLTLHNSNSNTASSCVHGSHKKPLIGFIAIGLNRCQT